MTNIEKMNALYALANPENANTMAATAASLLSAMLRGEVTEKQAALIDRIIGVGAVESLKFPATVSLLTTLKQVSTEIGGIKITMRYTSPTSPRSKPENRGTIAIAAGEYGSADAKWYGRIGTDGTLRAGKDWCESVANWVQHVEATAAAAK